MSAIIKGMKKSSACEWCKFICGSGIDWYCGAGRFMIYDYKSVHKDCPLINIPTPHGRLIDADELTRYIEHAYGDRDIVKLVTNNIARQQTIIEAEE